MTDTAPTSRPRPRSGSSGGALPQWTVRLAGAWILAGALFKLLLGTPADLPQSVRELPIELGLTYKLAITAELVLAALAFLRPRWGWLPLCAALLVFDAVLLGQIAAGEASCGCFGSSIAISPRLMLAIDTVFLAAILGARPWRPRARPARKAAGVVVLSAAIALAVALPWLLDRQVGPGSVEVDGQPVRGAWLELDVESWVGRDVWDTPLAEHVDVMTLPLDGLWIFWRQTCDHCAEHLAELARTETGERFVTLVQLRERHDTEANRVVHEMPAGPFVQHAALPDSVTYVITTPAEMVLEGGRIVEAREGVGG